MFHIHAYTLAIAKAIPNIIYGWIFFLTVLLWGIAQHLEIHTRKLLWCQGILGKITATLTHEKDGADSPHTYTHVNQESIPWIYICIIDLIFRTGGSGFSSPLPPMAISQDFQPWLVIVGAFLPGCPTWVILEGPAFHRALSENHPPWRCLKRGTR